MKTKLLHTLCLFSLLFTPLYIFGRQDWSATGQETESSDTLNFNLQTESFEVPDSLREYYDYAQADSIMRLTLVLSDIYSKKDMEFTRGFLMGMARAGLSAGSVSLKIINGEIPEDSLQYELELTAPHVVVSTFEKNAPGILRTFSQENGSQLLNAFDAKGDDYLYNSGIFQLLAPSDKFNSEIAGFITRNFSGNVLVLVGEPDLSDDAMLRLIRDWPEEELMILSKQDLGAYVLEDGLNYLFYPLDTSNDEIRDVISEIVRLTANMPSAGVRIFGRPNWIAFNDLNSMISNMEVYIPAKCYFDPASEPSKRFISGYNSMFGHAPIRSYPVYAVMGYDTARYFLPQLLRKMREGETDWAPLDMEQSYFNIKKSDWGGFYNSGGYILHYEPWGTMTKELLD